MSFELVVSIVSLAIAFGQVYAASKKSRAPTIIFSSAACALVIATWAGWKYYSDIQHQKQIASRADKVYSVLDRPKTFDDIMNSLNFNAFDEVNQAMDFLYEEGRIKPVVTNVQGPDGHNYALRTFVRAR